jgi:hypothetical protein
MGRKKAGATNNNIIHNFDNEMWLNIRLSFIKMHLILREW